MPRTGRLLERSALSDLPSPMPVIEAPDTAKQILALMDKRGDLDDVQRVSSCFEVTEALMTDLTSQV